MEHLKIEYLPISDFKPYENNAKIHTEEQIEQIEKSIKEYGMCDPIGVWHDEIVEGHGRLLALKNMGETIAPFVRLDHLTDEERREYMLVHNQLTMNTGFDENLLRKELETIEKDLSDFDLSEFPQKNVAEEKKEHEKMLEKRFLVPPFSILDARQGYWTERKRAWKELIGDTGQARESVNVIAYSAESGYVDVSKFNDASILDPVLSEVICRWFTPNNKSKCFDVFAGDTVFGYVSSHLGHEFTGIELRQEQSDFNNAQCNGLNAKYICDDGRNVLRHIKKQSQDLFFSCPPYYVLEVYSDLEDDASNQETYEDFYKIIDTAFTNGIKCLKENRFAVVVCGDVRNKKTGEYYGFPDDIKTTFRKNGTMLYNELILIDPIGTAAFRAGKYMDSRKVAKVHQNVLVFYKGNTKEIKNEFPRLEVEYESEHLE